MSRLREQQLEALRTSHKSELDTAEQAAELEKGRQVRSALLALGQLAERFGFEAFGVEADVLRLLYDVHVTLNGEIQLLAAFVVGRALLLVKHVVVARSDIHDPATNISFFARLTIEVGQLSVTDDVVTMTTRRRTAFFGNDYSQFWIPITLFSIFFLINFLSKPENCSTGL